MTKIPSLEYRRVGKALQRDGWIVLRQRGSHIRLRKRFETETLDITVPAHISVKRSTLARIIKQARLTVDEFIDLL